MKCRLCGIDVQNNRALATHLQHHHPEYDSERYWREVDDPRCVICGEPAKHNTGRIFRKTCGSKECKIAKCYLRCHTDKTKMKIRKKRLAYLAKRTGKTAWERRAAGKMSWLENWFATKVVDVHNLDKQYQIIIEFPLDVYSIDFAFVDLKLAVELDGACHFTNGKKRIEHDIKRDQFFLEHGWRVYRIPYFDVQENELKTIDDFLIFLTSSFEVVNNAQANLIRYKEWKNNQQLVSKEEHLPRRERTRLNRKQWLLKQQIKKEALLSSDIDFSKWGWVSKAASIIGIQPGKVSWWMKRVLPDFYEKQCFRRKQS